MILLPAPPKVRALNLIPGVVLLLVGILWPAIEVFDRQQTSIDVHTVTVSDAYPESEAAGETDSSTWRYDRACEFKLPDGTTEAVQCPLAKSVGDEIQVYEGDRDVWRVYKTGWFLAARGVLITLLGVAYIWWWIWARRYHMQGSERANEGDATP